jgi:UDP-N-acetylglucosamine 2-epimerase
MYDSVLSHLDRAKTLVSRSILPSGDYALATLHRAENTDDRARLIAILDGLSQLPLTVLLPLHPRTRKILESEPEIARHLAPSVIVAEPLGYLELLLTMSRAKLVLTDSGGMQKEAFFLGVPCVTLRDETEWIETIELGANRLAGASTEAIVKHAATALQQPVSTIEKPYGDGHAAEKIVACLEDHA